MSNNVTIQLPDGNTTTVVTESSSSLSVVAPSENSISLVTENLGSVSIESPSVQSVSVENNTPSVLGVVQQDSNQVTISSAVTQTSSSGSAWGSIIGTITDQTDLVNYISSQSGSSWGSITGTLDTQTDLINYITNQLLAKEDAANKSDDTNLGSSDVFFPTQNAVKTYVNSYVSNEINNYEMFAKYKVQETDEDGLFLYVGKIKATNGVWLIEKYVDTSGDFAVSYANISNNSAHEFLSTAWTSRASLSYTTIDSLTNL